MNPIKAYPGWSYVSETHESGTIRLLRIVRRQDDRSLEIRYDSAREKRSYAAKMSIASFLRTERLKVVKKSLKGEIVYVDQFGRVWRRVTPQMAAVLREEFKNGLYRRAKSNGRTLEIRSRGDFRKLKSEVSLGEKVDHVLKAKQTREHYCHAEGCNEPVKPAMVMCKRHWMSLPKPLRDDIWAAYELGQEERMSATSEYVRLIRHAIAYIKGSQPRRKGGGA